MQIFQCYMVQSESLSSISVTCFICCHTGRGRFWPNKLRFVYSIRKYICLYIWVHLSAFAKSMLRWRYFKRKRKERKEERTRRKSSEEKNWQEGTKKWKRKNRTEVMADLWYQEMAADMSQLMIVWRISGLSTSLGRP